MKRITFNLALAICLNLFAVLMCNGQDIFTRGLVYQLPAMKEVIINEKLIYRNVNDTALSFDIYYPPGFDFKKDLPVVVFNNGVGSMDIPRWGIYKDWAKLTAAKGMIAVNHQARPGNALNDGEALLDYLVKNSAGLKIDPDRIGLWTCSANARTGMRLAYKTRLALVRALVIYYGGPDSLGQLRQDMPTLMVRAGLDAQFINTGVDNFVQSALQQDTRIELINYVSGMHAFDAFQPVDESKKIIIRTIDFFKNNLVTDSKYPAFVLTNKNFMWLIMNNQLSKAIEEFRKAKEMYKTDPAYHPFYNAVTREDVLNANAYWLQNNRRQADAMELFKLAVETFPESPNAYESLSEAYDLAGNKAEAIRNAEICLQKLPTATGMNENFKQQVKQSAEERLKRLKEIKPVSQNSPPKRAHHELVYDEQAKTVLLTAGSTPLNEGSSFEFFNDLWRFDGKQWKQAGKAGDQRSGIRMAWDTKRNKLYSYGGFANNNSLAELRVMENGEWKVLSDNEEMKAAEAGFVYDAKRDKLIAFGGSAGIGLANGTTWEWDAAGWKKFEGNGPGPRQAFAMVYDSKRQVTVLYGGMDTAGKAYEDGIWEFDGKIWKNIPTKGINPGSRTSSGYAFDSKRGLFILFSGGTLNGAKSDTWSWNGKEWKLLAEKGPAARYMGYMVYDKSRDRIVLFGGRLGWPNDTNDTWEWDGKEWKEIKLD